MAVFAPLLFASSLIKSPADLLRCGGSGVGWGVGGSIGCWIREPGEERAVWVVWAVGCKVIILQTEGASGNGTCPARKGFIIELRVRYRPVEIFFCEGLSSKLAVISNLLFTLVVPLRSYDGRLISP